MYIYICVCIVLYCIVLYCIVLYAYTRNTYLTMATFGIPWHQTAACCTLMMFAVDVLLHQCSRCNDAEKEPGNIALYCPGSSLIIVVCIGWEFEMSTLTGPGAYAFERELLSLPFEI